MRATAIVFELLLLAMLGYIFFISAKDLLPRQRLVPLVIAIPTAAMLVFTIAGEVFPRLMSRFNVSLVDFMPATERAEVSRMEKAAEAGQGVVSSSLRTEFRQIAGILAWMWGYFVFSFLFGMLIGIPSFLVVFLTIYSRLEWWKTLLTTIGIMLIIWGAFMKLLGLQLWTGVVEVNIGFLSWGGEFIPPI
jgi:hypothetical protein